MILVTHTDSPLGNIRLTAEDDRLIGLHLTGQKHGLLPDTSVTEGDSPVFTVVKEWLDAYFGKMRPTIPNLPLAPAGTPFQQTVWELLGTIPYGQTVTYGEIARECARLLGCERMSAQAVGGAVGRNPIAILIPCHRVVGATGNLTGYDGGIEHKIRLLRHEGVDLTEFHSPK